MRHVSKLFSIVCWEAWVGVGGEKIGGGGKEKKGAVNNGGGGIEKCGFIFVDCWSGFWTWPIEL